MLKKCHGRWGLVVASLSVLGHPAISRAQMSAALSAPAELASNAVAPIAATPHGCTLATTADVPQLSLSDVINSSPEQKAEVSSCSLPEAQAPVRPSAPNLFGSVAVPLGPSVLDVRWKEVSKLSLEGLDGPWSILIAELGEAQGSERLQRVNRWVNEHVRYTNDGGQDHWSDAVSTIISGQGDCEDYAIAKMELLQRLGVPSEDMYLVIVRDGPRQMDHAILAVRQGEGLYVLDNRTDMLLTAEQISDYRPKLSYSGAFAWAYGYRVSGKSVGALHE